MMDPKQDIAEQHSHIGAIGHSAMHVLNGRGAGLLEETFSIGRKPVKKNVSSLSSLKVGKTLLLTVKYKFKNKRSYLGGFLPNS